MTEEEIREWIKKIKINQGDPEVAHSEEDSLYIAFIEYIKDAAPEPFSKLAGIVLTTNDMNFPRWCA